MMRKDLVRDLVSETFLTEMFVGSPGVLEDFPYTIRRLNRDNAEIVVQTSGKPRTFRLTLKERM